jgi:hypothetical protein
MEKREMGGLLKKMGFNRRTIKNYLSGLWGISEEIKQKLKEMEKDDV